MLLPNKLFSYTQSVFSKLPAFLESLDTPLSVEELYQAMQDQIHGPLEFMDVLDCLYALSKIDIDDKGKIFKC